MASGGVGELGLGDRQHVVAHERGNGAATVGEGAHGLDHALCRGGAAGCGQRHQPVRQREGRHAVADPCFGLVGKFLPTIADIDAEALQAKEHGRRVLHIDVDVGRSDRERRGEIAEAGVVELEHRGMIAVLQLEQRAVPPEMVLQVVGPLPVGRERREPLNAFAAAALRLQDMGDGVRRPEIAGVELDGAASVGLCCEIVPGLLVGERAAGE